MSPLKKVVYLLLIAVCLFSKEGHSVPIEKLEEKPGTMTKLPSQSAPTILSSSKFMPEPMPEPSSQPMPIIPAASKEADPENDSDEFPLRSTSSVPQDDMKTADTILWKYFGGGGHFYQPYPRFGYFPQYYAQRTFPYHYYKQWHI